MSLHGFLHPFRARLHLDCNSLQVRLTAGFVMVSIAGMGSIAGWMGWRTHQILLESHKEKIYTTTQRFAADVTQYQGAMSMPIALEKAIAYRTTGDTVIWIKSPTGEMIAHSDTLAMGAWQSSGVAQSLLDLELHNGLTIRPIEDWSVLICAYPLVIADNPFGTLYIAEDITAEQASFEQLVRTLAIASLLSISALAVAIALYVRHALSPLHQLNQLATQVTADTLADSHLTLKAAPTEVKELAHSYNLMLDRLTQAWQQQKRLVNNLSHELRTPLTLVQGYLQSTLRRAHSLTAPQREGLEVAYAEAGYTIRLLQDLLALARMENGQIQLTLEPLDLKEIILAVMARSTAEGASRLVPQIDAAPLVVQGHRDSLEEALWQLVDNALRYSPAAEPVEIRLARVGSQARIQVSDRGRGIPPHCQANIFEPFYRVDEDRCRTTGGTGLGLTVAKILIARMHGQITVASAPGQGSTFTLTLPLGDPP